MEIFIALDYVVLIVAIMVMRRALRTSNAPGTHGHGAFGRTAQKSKTRRDLSQTG